MTPCVLFTGYRNKQGYGVQVRAGVRKMAHRWAWEDANGPVPEGYELDHACHGPECAGGPTCPHRACINVEHLRLVTHAENQAKLRRTHCRRGHELMPANRVVKRRGHLGQCRKCLRIYHRTYYERHKENWR